MVLVQKGYLIIFSQKFQNIAKYAKIKPNFLQTILKLTPKSLLWYTTLLIIQRREHSGCCRNQVGIHFLVTQDSLRSQGVHRLNIRKLNELYVP